jgi:tetratricopeptide (TPR) repeat protein
MNLRVGGSKHHLKLLLLVTFFFLQACSVRLPPAGVAAYEQCDYTKAIDIFSKTKKKEKDELLYDLAILSAAVHQGDWETAKVAGKRSQDRMWSYEGQSRGTASLISSEALRIYKGEPFEKTMASLYLGIIYFNEQDYDNAKAAFTKAMFAVQTKGEDSQADFAAPYLLLAKTYLKLKDKENANILLKRMEKMGVKNLTLESIQKIRTIAFIELGKGPVKFRTGPGDSLIGWQRQPYTPRTSTLLIDGSPAKNAFKVDDDLTYQAQSVDRGGKETIQGTKGVLREASAVTAVIAANEAVNRKNETAGWVALGAGLFALANQSQADLRQWELLPDRLDLLLTEDPVSEGRHQFEVQFGGSFLSSSNQVWYDDRKPDLDKIYIVPSKLCNKP